MCKVLILVVIVTQFCHSLFVFQMRPVKKKRPFSFLSIFTSFGEASVYAWRRKRGPSNLYNPIPEDYSSSNQTAADLTVVRTVCMNTKRSSNQHTQTDTRTRTNSSITRRN